MSIEQFTGGVAFPLHKQMHNRIIDTIFEFDGRVSLTSVLGVLELVKVDLIREADKGVPEGGI